MGGIVSAAGNIIGILGTMGKEKKADKKQNEAEEEAAKIRALEQREANARNRREQIKQLAQARVLRAQIRAGAAASGVQGSSGAEGGSGSIMSQGASNAGFISQLMSISQEKFAANERQIGLLQRATSIRRRAAKYRAYNQAMADMGAAVTSFGMSSGSGQTFPASSTPPAQGYSSINPWANSGGFNSGMRF